MEILSLIFMIFMAVISYFFLPYSFYKANKYKKILLSKLTNILPSIKNITVNDIYHFRENDEYENPLHIGISKIVGHLKVGSVSEIFSGIALENEKKGVFIETGDISVYEIKADVLPATDGNFEECAVNPNPELIKISKKSKIENLTNYKALVISDFLLDKSSGHLKTKSDSDFPMFVFLYDFDDSYLFNLLTMSLPKKTEISYLLVFLFAFLLTPVLSLLLGLQNYETSNTIGKILYCLAGFPFVMIAPPFTFIFLRLLKMNKKIKIEEKELTFYSPTEPYKEKSINEALETIQENPNTAERMKVKGKIVSYKKSNDDLIVFLIADEEQYIAVNAFNMKLRGFDLIKSGIEKDEAVEEIYRQGEKVLHKNEEVNVYGCIRVNNDGIPFLSTPDLNLIPIIITPKKTEEVLEIKKSNNEKNRKSLFRTLFIGLGIQFLIVGALVFTVFSVL